MVWESKEKRCPGDEITGLVLQIGNFTIAQIDKKIYRYSTI